MPRPRPHCVRWGPSCPYGNGHNSPHFRGCLRPYKQRPMSIVSKRSPISATTELLCGPSLSALVGMDLTTGAKVRRQECCSLYRGLAMQPSSDDDSVIAMIMFATSAPDACALWSRPFADFESTQPSRATVHYVQVSTRLLVQYCSKR